MTYVLTHETIHSFDKVLSFYIVCLDPFGKLSFQVHPFSGRIIIIYEVGRLDT